MIELINRLWEEAEPFLAVVGALFLLDAIRKAYREKREEEENKRRFLDRF